MKTQRRYITAVTYELIQGDFLLYSVYVTADNCCRAVYGVGLLAGIAGLNPAGGMDVCLL